MHTPCFTLDYAAPEVLRQAMPGDGVGYDESCDLWSLGVVLVRPSFTSDRAEEFFGFNDVGGVFFSFAVHDVVRKDALPVQQS